MAYCYDKNLCQKLTAEKKFIGGNRDASAVSSAKTRKTLVNLKQVDPKRKIGRSQCAEPATGANHGARWRIHGPQEGHW